MTTNWALLGVVLAFGVLLISSAAPVSAQGGLVVSLSSNCQFTHPGSTVTTEVVVSDGASANVTVALIGSLPKDSNATVLPASGTAPFNTTLTLVVANSVDTVGNYQMGVVVRTPSEYHVSLFTLRVLAAGETPPSDCSRIGLPLPDSTFTVTATSLGLGLLTQLVTRRVVDLDRERKMKAEVTAFQKEKREATQSKDKAKLDKLKKRELQVTQLQSKIQLARFKVTAITIIPLFAVYYLMATFLGGYGAIVAVSPIPIPYLVGPNGEMVLIWWYILGSFTLSSILAKLLKTTT